MAVNRSSNPTQLRRSSPGRPRVPAAQRRERILNAFQREVLRTGSIAGVGVRAVVERAGCSAPVLYRLFGDRAGLVRAAVRGSHLPLIERMEIVAADGGGSAGERIRSLAASYLRRESTEREAFEALVNVECRSDPQLARLVREVFGRFEALLVAIFQEGIDVGEFRSGTDPLFSAWRLIDLGLFRNQARLMRLTRPDQIDYVFRAVDGLLAEIGA